MHNVDVSPGSGGRYSRISFFISFPIFFLFLFRVHLGLDRNPLAQMEEERRDHEAKMKKMEQEMEQVFEMKVKEKTQKLKDSETDVIDTHALMIRFVFFYFFEIMFSSQINAVHFIFYFRFAIICH